MLRWWLRQASGEGWARLHHRRYSQWTTVSSFQNQSKKKSLLGTSPRAYHAALWEAAKVELRTRPEQTLRQILAPVRCLIVPVSVVDPDTAQLRTFLFYVDIWVRPGERTVVYVLMRTNRWAAPGQAVAREQHRYGPTSPTRSHRTLPPQPRERVLKARYRGPRGPELSGDRTA